jgi:hypothetical protein
MDQDWGFKGRDIDPEAPLGEAVRLLSKIDNNVSHSNYAAVYPIVSLPGKSFSETIDPREPPVQYPARSHSYKSTGKESCRRRANPNSSFLVTDGSAVAGSKQRCLYPTILNER